MPNLISTTKVKVLLGVAVALLLVVAPQVYPRSQFTKITGLHLPKMSLAVKWSSELDDFFAVFLTTPESAHNLLLQPGVWPGKPWRNDTLHVAVYSSRRNVPFFDLHTNALMSPDDSRWFLENIVKKSTNNYILRGAVVVVYPEQGLIFINAGG